MRVKAVSQRRGHSFSKDPALQITLLEGEGVAGDGHLGKTVQHRSRVAKNPDQPNLRQVHLLSQEIFNELAQQGFAVSPGDLGENVFTQGIDLLRLSEGAQLRLGAEAVIEITGLRNPCSQLDAFQPGLMSALRGRDACGGIVRKAGVMAIVVRGGDVAPGDTIQVVRQPIKFKPLQAV